MNSLASEILHVITDLLEDDQQTLAQLTYVSRTLHDVGTPYLYKCPSILTSHQLTLLSRFLTPKHSDCIKSFSLQLIPDRNQLNIDHILESILGRTNNLERLDLGFCNLDPRRIVSVIAHCDKLHYFSLNGVGNVTDQVISAFVQDHPNMLQLYISSAVITDSSVYEISRCCPFLEELDISGCEHISEDGIRFLTQQSKNLQYINIKDCYNIIPEDGEFDGLPTTTDDIWETDEDSGSDVGEGHSGH